MRCSERIGAVQVARPSGAGEQPRQLALATINSHIASTYVQRSTPRPFADCLHGPRNESSAALGDSRPCSVTPSRASAACRRDRTGTGLVEPDSRH
jgi:hypothetical protein